MIAAPHFIERRPYAKILRDLQDQHIIKVVTGLRRAGKSTLLEMHADQIRRAVPDASIQFLNFEDPDVFAIGDWKAIYDYVKVRLAADRMNYVFLDEVQNVPTFERLVDGLFIKKNVDLYITGSNARLLSGELATLLTGRYIETEILPFSFAEYMDATGKSAKLAKNESLADFVTNGGLPTCVEFSQSTSQKPDDFARGILNTIIEKDIYARHEIYNKTAFEKVLDFVLDSVGSIVSPRSITNTLRSNGILVDKETVAFFLQYMSEAFLFYKVSRYDLKGKGLLQTLDKYYAADPIFRKIRLGERISEDRGHLLENAVYLELRRRNSEVHIGKLRDKEVDFVVMDSSGHISYYQVAWHINDPATLERELAPLRAVRDSNPKYLLSTDLDVNPVYDGIRKLNVADWLLGEPQNG